MNTSTKEWLTHCVVPHNMQEVSEEYHEMWHDQNFMVLNGLIISLIILTSLIVLGVYLLPGGEMPYNPQGYNPYSGYYFGM